MKLLIIGNAKSIESALLKKEAKERNHQIEIFPLRSLVLKQSKKLSISLPDGRNIGTFDAVLFRAINHHIAEAKIAAKFMHQAGKVVVDEILAKGDYENHKFLTQIRLAEKNTPQPLTFLPLNIRAVKLILRKVKTPLIVKNIRGMHGRSLFRFDSKNETLNFFSKNRKRLGLYLIQKWYPSKKYFRTLLIGNRVLGCMERLSLKCKNRPNLPLGRRSKKARLTNELSRLSLKTIKACGLDFAGIDIIPDENNQLRVLEVNRSPQFKRFTKVTGVEVAKEVIKYIESKVGILKKS